MNLYRLLQKRKRLTWADAVAGDGEAVRFRHEMEAVFIREAEEVAK
jgi:hypothetical protein